MWRDICCWCTAAPIVPCTILHKESSAEVQSKPKPLLKYFLNIPSTLIIQRCPGAFVGVIKTHDPYLGYTDSPSEEEIEVIIALTFKHTTHLSTLQMPVISQHRTMEASSIRLV